MFYVYRRVVDTNRDFTFICYFERDLAGFLTFKLDNAKSTTLLSFKGSHQGESSTE